MYLEQKKFEVQPEFSYNYFVRLSDLKKLYNERLIELFYSTTKI